MLKGGGGRGEKYEGALFANEHYVASWRFVTAMCLTRRYAVLTLKGIRYAGLLTQCMEIENIKR